MDEEPPSVQHSKGSDDTGVGDKPALGHVHGVSVRGEEDKARAYILTPLCSIHGVGLLVIPVVAGEDD